MESGPRYRKRKQRPSESDPFDGIFTRSRSQIYFHRNRSGYARGDSNRSRHLIKSQEGTAKSLLKHVKDEPTEAAVDQSTSGVSVKDLRARRVFSPATITENVASGGEVDLESGLDACKKSDGSPNVVDSSSEIDAGYRDLTLPDSDAIDLKASLESAINSSSENDAGHSDIGVPDSAAIDLKASLELVIDHSSENDARHGDLGVPDSAAIDLKANSESVIDSSSARESNAMEADDVQMTPTIAESNLDKRPGEKHDMANVANEIVNNLDSVTKNQSLVPTLRGRRKVFKSPSSFSYRRLLPYLMNLENEDSSSLEIVEATLPKEEEICPVSSSINLADGLSNNAKSFEPAYANSVKSDSVSTFEVSNVVNDTQDEFEQMTPPDLDVYSKSKIKTISGVPLKPAIKPVLKSCSRLKALQNPTSFSHRRLLPFLMSVVDDDSGTSKSDQSSKPEKAPEQNQEPPTHTLLHQDEKSDSPTSTLNPTDMNFDKTKTVTLVSSDMLLDANGPDKECSGSISQLEVSSQVEAIKSDGCIKSEQSPPKAVTVASSEILANVNGPDKECSGSISQAEAVKSDSCVKAEQSPPKAVTLVSNETLSDANGSISQLAVNLQPDAVESGSCIKSEQSPPKNSLICVEEDYSKNKQKSVIETPGESFLQIAQLNAFGVQAVNVKTGILKRTPRGCRGICNCLNCTSFRLHAERSFEFSRNQMHDAEELALDLMNDLTCVRNILEGIATDSNSLDTMKEKQVKEACAKALYKEQVARAQLAQMNEDLSIHCRSMISLRPKVTFANKIEKKVIPKSV